MDFSVSSEVSTFHFRSEEYQSLLENINILLDDYIPHGIDVSSGVESIIGVKDHKKIKNFIKTVRSYE